MSDAPPPVRAEPTADGRRDVRPLTPARIDAVLADFRRWLESLADAGGVAPGRPPEPVDLGMLVGQFTALRHEVNLQTRASRAAVEQNAETVKQLAAATAPTDVAGVQRPLVKALIDIADVLVIGLRQVEQAVAGLEAAPEPPRPGFLARLFASPAAAPSIQPRLAGVADGYALSLRRVERALAGAGLEAVECVGRPFDPERMEVVEAVAADAPTGTVIEEVRRGYRWNGTLFRYAQVKVAR
ncbi:MAG: nucleotide exchange factor GrpE [Gemmataceae bacterium]